MADRTHPTKEQHGEQYTCHSEWSALIHLEYGIQSIRVDAPHAPNANPAHIESLYAPNPAPPPSPPPCPPASRAALLLKTTVEIANPNAVPSCVRVWKSAPPTDCSCGRQTRAMNRVPVAKTKSAPKTVTMDAGKPKAQ